MRRRDTGLDPEFETELEQEAELEFEGEGMQPDRMPAGEGEYELEAEFEGEFEGEFEAEFEGEFEFEDEGEQFSFGSLAKRIGGFVKRAAPILKQVARVAAPMVGTAIGGPFGTILGGLATQALGDGEGEFELEEEFEGEFELEEEYELAPRPMTAQEALAELMAAASAGARTEAEAEAMIGAATVSVLTAEERRLLRRLLPHLVRATCVLVKVLRKQRATRPAVRVVPTIVSNTARVLADRAGDGHPVTRRTAARVMASQTHRVLADPRRTASALQHNVRASAAARRSGGGARTPARSNGHGHHHPAYR